MQELHSLDVRVRPAARPGCAPPGAAERPLRRRLALLPRVQPPVTHWGGAEARGCGAGCARADAGPCGARLYGACDCRARGLGGKVAHDPGRFLADRRRNVPRHLHGVAPHACAQRVHGEGTAHRS